MDSASIRKKETNPKANANILSQIFFFFALKTILKGARKEFDQDDIYEILEGYTSEKLGAHLDALWIKEFKKPRPAIWRCLFKMFGLQYLLIGIVDLAIGVSYSILQPILTGKVISYFDPRTKLTQEDALIYAVELLGCSIFFSIYDSTYFFLVEQLCMRMRIAGCSLMYRKCLRLSTASLSKYAGGKVVTIMTKDMVYFDSAADYGHMFMHCIIKMILMTYIMYREIGDAALYGSSLLFIMLPICVGQGQYTYKVETEFK